MSEQRRSMQWSRESGLVIKTGPGLVESAQLEPVIIATGADFVLPVHYLDETAVVVDLSAATAVWRVMDGSTVAVSVTSAALVPPATSIVTLSAARPNIVITLSATLIATLTFTQGRQELFLTSGGIVTKVFEGLVRRR